MSLRGFDLRPRRSGRIPQWQMALLLIAVGVIGRLALWNVPNVETVLVVSLLAGMLLRGVYVLVVPIAVMALTDVLGYWLGWAGAYAPWQVVGLAGFVYSAFLFVTALGRVMRPRILFRTRTIAVMTTISIPATVLFDLWTAFGDWLLITSRPPFSWTFPQVLELQIPFTLVHIASSLIFVPLFGAMFVYLHVHGWPSVQPAPHPTERRGHAGSQKSFEPLPCPSEFLALPLEGLLLRVNRLRSGLGSLPQSLEVGFPGLEAPPGFFRSLFLSA